MRQSKTPMVNGQPIPMAPADYDVPDVAALQALQRGDATADQQRRALVWLVEKAALTYDLEYRTDPRDHAFCSGRRFVGLQIVKMLKLNLTTLTGKLKPNH